MVKVDGVSYIGRMVIYNYKGGEALVLDLPEDDQLWGDPSKMQAKVVHIQFLSKSKIGKAFYDWYYLTPTLKDEFLFILFQVGGAYFRLYVYELPYGNPDTKLAQQIAYFPRSSSKIYFCFYYVVHVLKLKENGKIVYRCSPKFFMIYKTNSFFFDPELKDDQFRILDAQFLSASEIFKTRLEVEGLFDSGSYLDVSERFEVDLTTRGSFVLITVAIIITAVLGLCGIRFYGYWKRWKKLRIANAKQLAAAKKPRPRVRRGLKTRPKNLT